MKTTNQQLLDRQMTHEDDEEVPPAVQHHLGGLQVIFGVFHPCLGFRPHRSTFISIPAPILPALWRLINAIAIASQRRWRDGCPTGLCQTSRWCTAAAGRCAFPIRPRLSRYTEQGLSPSPASPMYGQRLGAFLPGFNQRFFKLTISQFLSCCCAWSAHLSTA